MSLPSFDPTNTVTFDLARGLVRLDDNSARLLVPSSALLALAKAAPPEAIAAFARAVGEPLGARVAARLSGAEGLRTAPAEAVIEHLGGELALTGLGSLSLERWGRAMLLVVDQSPLSGDAVSLLAGILEGALLCATGREVRCVALQNSSQQSRFLVAGGAAATKAAEWLHAGVSWGEVLARLHAPSGGAS